MIGIIYQVQVMIIFENNKPNILFREHLHGMYRTYYWNWNYYWNANLNQICFSSRSSPLESVV